VALLPLLNRQVVVDELRLDGLRADLVKHKDGSTNFSDLTGGESAGKTQPEATRREPAKPQAGAKPAVRVDVSGIRITNSRVTWRDETNGNDVALDLIELKTGRLAEGVPSRVQLDVEL